MRKSKIVNHYLAQLTRLVDSKLSGPILLICNELLELLASESIGKAEIEGAMRMMEAIQYSLVGPIKGIFHKSEPRYFYFDLKAKNSWVAQEPPKSPALGKTCLPLSGEVIDLLKGLHAALGLMSRFNPEYHDNQVMTKEISIYQKKVQQFNDNQLNLNSKKLKRTTWQAKNWNDYGRDIRLICNKNNDLTVKSEEDGQRYITNFLDLYFRASQKKLDAVENVKSYLESREKYPEYERSLDAFSTYQINKEVSSFRRILDDLEERFERKELTKENFEKQRQQIIFFERNYNGLVFYKEMKDKAEIYYQERALLQDFFSTSLATQDLNIFLNEFPHCFDISRKDHKIPLTFRTSQQSLVWYVSERGQLMGQFKCMTDVLTDYNRAFVYDSAAEEMTEINLDDYKKKFPSFCECTLIAECMVKDGKLKVAVRELTLDHEFASNVHLIGKPEAVKAIPASAEPSPDMDPLGVGLQRR